MQSSKQEARVLPLPLQDLYLWIAQMGTAQARESGERESKNERERQGGEGTSWAEGRADGGCG
eukprot:4590763-Pleurochrysis_carterae.AAC.1